MILITGASGFIGGRMLRAVRSEGTVCRAISRTQIEHAGAITADLADKASLVRACSGVRCVFHCAGYAHAFASFSDTDEALHWKVNFEGTRNLLAAATQAGVRCFVNLSSVKAMAEPGEMCADEEFPGESETAYGKSKRAAEEIVLSIGKQSGMHVVNLRLAMVYGAGGRGNLERMARLVRRELFPPLPETGNRRSLVHVDDVVSAMRLVARDPRATGRTYIIAAPEAPSGRQLFDALRRVYGMRPCGWSVPASLLRGAAIGGDLAEAIARRRMPFDSEVLDRLLGSAWYSPARIEQELGWRARVSLSEGLLELVGK